MNSDAQAALTDFELHRITSDELVRRLGTDPAKDGSFVSSRLEHALAERTPRELGPLITVIARFGAWPEWAPVLGQLLLEPWHTQHEAIADTLQNLREPSTVEALFKGANARFDYRDYDEAESLGVRCLWALHDIGTPEAAERLASLARCDNRIVSERAGELLESLQARIPGEPAEAYRQHRDGRVHGL